MLKKIILRSFITVVILSILCTTICYATAVPVTKENLKSTLENLKESIIGEEGSNISISVTDSTISISLGEQSYTLNYDLSEKPTFTYAVDIEKRMKYKDFEEKTQMLMLPIIGYVAVANIQGAQVDDIITYVLFTIMGSAMNIGDGSNSEYKLVDDLNGETAEDPNANNIIYTSKFGDKVIEYVNSIYKNKQEITDSTNLNSFKWAMEQTEKGETSCKLVSTLVVDPNANFASLNSGEGETQKPSGDEGNTQKPSGAEGGTQETEEKGNNLNQPSKDNTTSNIILPQTGVSGIILATIVICIIFVIIFKVKVKEYKDIK